MAIFGFCIANVDNDITMPGNKIANAQPMPQAIVFNKPGLPLDVQLDLDKRLSRESPIKDSINIIDSVRWVTKTKWKTRYKNVADRTTAREAGTHPWAIIPDSMKENPAIISTMGREENPMDTVGVSKASSIQLIVDDKLVYSTNDNHSGVGGQ